MDEPRESAGEPLAPPADMPAQTSGLDASAGMGPTPSGPGFAPWHANEADRGGPGQSLGAAERVPGPDLNSFRAPSARLPALVTALVVTLVAAIVLAATVVANRRDQQVVLPVPTIAPASPFVPPHVDSIEFASSEGSGLLVVLDHHWTSAGSRPAQTGSYLQVEVELVCISGQIRFDPDFFQAFDMTGRLFDVTESASSLPVLESGTLGPAERVRGFIAFDMPRGEVTLLMTDDGAQSVTALKIPD